MVNLKLLVGAGIPVSLLGIDYYQNNTKTPIKMIIKDKQYMTVKFKPSFGLDITSLNHTFNDQKLGYNYISYCGNLIILKNGIFSVRCMNKDDKKNNFDDIMSEIKKSTLKTHITYNTLFTKNKKIVLDWNNTEIIYKK